MSETVRTVRVVAAHPSQGECVVINEDDFDPSVHRLFDGCQTAVDPAPAPRRRGRPPKHMTGESQDGNG